MTRDIREAKKTVNLETYIFQPDRAGRMFADAMIDAAQTGRRGAPARRRAGQQVQGPQEGARRRGREGAKFRPIRLFAIHKIGRRTHRKILVVDGRIATPAASASTSAGSETPATRRVARHAGRPWRARSPAQMQAIFSERLDLHDRRDPRRREVLSAAVPPAGDVTRAGDQGLAAATRRRWPRCSTSSRSSSAARSIHIQNAYFLPDKQVREALIARGRSGASTSRSWFPDATSTCPWCARRPGDTTASCSKAGVRICEYQPTMLHNKTMVVDGIYSTIGSINFDARSMSRTPRRAWPSTTAASPRRWRRCSRTTRSAARRSRYAEWKHRGFTKRLSEYGVLGFSALLLERRFALRYGTAPRERTGRRLARLPARPQRLIPRFASGTLRGASASIAPLAETPHAANGEGGGGGATRKRGWSRGRRRGPAGPRLRLRLRNRAPCSTAPGRRRRACAAAPACSPRPR